MGAFYQECSCMLSFVTQVGRVTDPARLLAWVLATLPPCSLLPVGRGWRCHGEAQGCPAAQMAIRPPCWGLGQAAPFSFLLTPCLRSSLWRQSLRPLPAPRSCQALHGRVPCVSTAHRLSTILRLLLCWAQNIPLTPAPPLPFCFFSKLFVFAQNNHREV